MSSSAQGSQPTIDKYEVSGNDSAQLIASLDLNGPGDGWGRTNHDWAVGYTMNELNKKHTVVKVDVEHSIRIEMPIWRGYSKSSACMKKSWDDMYRNLKKHEDKHVELGNGVSEKIKKMLLAIPAQDSKNELEALIKKINTEIQTENQAKQDKFDTDTDHGKNAGNDSIVLKPC